ncbi:nodulation-signaling pathway 2 protein-like [Heracleum sosnowskyi]|uniref:Nodulation-signaling pathway 2 protein-like n=1 Tax=Heracleum sosnowskyi TaxID=360622 RepID=A0AAD8LWW0_9APIA|nr:nodulation-signaling pathway 2 protein-like [Heracleum sosnowskyi]
MMQSQLYLPSWELYNTVSLNLDQPMQISINNHQFSPSITTCEGSLTNSSDSYFPAILTDELADYSFSDDQMQDILPTESFEAISNDEIETMCGWLDASEGKENIFSQLPSDKQDFGSPDLSSMEVKDSWSSHLLMESYNETEFLQSENQSLILPSDDMEIDIQSSLRPLLVAYGEAVDEGQSLLAEVIVKRVNEKVSPVGETLERVAFNVFQSMENQGCYIKQEAIKNLEAAFKAFYEIFPYGRFCHFAANSAILEAMPDDAEIIHIVDFDMGAGIQWPSLIEALGGQNKALKLTSVIVEHDNVSNPTIWKFEEAKSRLYEYARSFDLNLMVEEMTLGDLMKNVAHLKTLNQREWLAFNCITNLPHTGSRRSRSDILKYISVAKTVLVNSETYKGILTLGHGEDVHMTKSISRFSSYFSENLMHFNALFESMECSFPAYFAEGRLAMESLFLAPYVSSPSCLQRWEEIKNGPVSEAITGLQGLKVSKENLVEAKEMVKEGETYYAITTEGLNENEMILEWKGSPLVRVSTWM